MSEPIRVAVTGIGSISSLGHTVPDIWASLEAGKCGIGTITAVPPEQLNIKIAAEVKNYDETKHFDDRELLVFAPNPKPQTPNPKPQTPNPCIAEKFHK